MSDDNEYPALPVTHKIHCVCPCCGAEFDEVEELARHVSWKLIDKDRKWGPHVRTGMTPKYPCWCGEVFRSRYDMAAHLIHDVGMDGLEAHYIIGTMGEK